MKGDPRTHGLWEQTAPPAPETSPLAGAVEADVAVVGAGFTGLSAALHLAQAGAKVVVLEGEDVGFGGSGRNVGLLNAGLWLPPADVVAALGEERGGRLLDLLGAAPQLVRDLIAEHAIDCELTATGTLHCGVGRAGLAELRERTTQWLERGAPVRLLDAAETARLTGSPRFSGALLDLRAGTVQPLAYARGLARAAIAAGARIHTSSRVLAAERGGSRWALTTGQGRALADWVVVATNAYTSGVWPQVRAELVRLPYFNFATEPLPEKALAAILPGRQGCWDTQTVLSSFRLDRAGRLVFGSVGALRGTGTGIHQAWATRAIRRHFPGLGPVGLTSGWYGMIGMSSDSIPRFHRLAPQVIGFSAYNGRGIAPGTAFGKLLAQLVQGSISDADLPLPVSEPETTPLRQIREAGYEAGAQLLHLAGERV